MEDVWKNIAHGFALTDPIAATCVGEPIPNGEFFICADGRYLCGDARLQSLKMCEERNTQGCPPLCFVLENLKPTQTHDNYTFSLKVKGTSHWVAVVRGFLKLVPSSNNSPPPTMVTRFYRTQDNKIACYNPSPPDDVALWTVIDSGNLTCVSYRNTDYLADSFCFLTEVDKNRLNGSAPTAEFRYVKPEDGIYIIVVRGAENCCVFPGTSNNPSIKASKPENIDAMPRFVLKNEYSCPNGKHLFSLKSVASNSYIKAHKPGSALHCGGNRGREKGALFFMTEDHKIGSKHSLKNYRGFKDFWKVENFVVSRGGDRHGCSPAHFDLIRMDLKRETDVDRIRVIINIAQFSDTTRELSTSVETRKVAFIENLRSQTTSMESSVDLSLSSSASSPHMAYLNLATELNLKTFLGGSTTDSNSYKQREEQKLSSKRSSRTMAKTGKNEFVFNVAYASIVHYRHPSSNEIIARQILLTGPLSEATISKTAHEDIYTLDAGAETMLNGDGSAEWVTSYGFRKWSLKSSLSAVSMDTAATPGAVGGPSVPAVASAAVSPAKGTTSTAPSSSDGSSPSSICETSPGAVGGLSLNTLPSPSNGSSLGFSPVAVAELGAGLSFHQGNSVVCRRLCYSGTSSPSTPRNSSAHSHNLPISPQRNEPPSIPTLSPSSSSYFTPISSPGSDSRQTNRDVVAKSAVSRMFIPCCTIALLVIAASVMWFHHALVNHDVKSCDTLSTNNSTKTVSSLTVRNDSESDTDDLHNDICVLLLPYGKQRPTCPIPSLPRPPVCPALYNEQPDKKSLFFQFVSFFHLSTADEPFDPIRDIFY